MQREQADPACDVQYVLVGVIALDRNFVGDVVDHDDPVEEHECDENQQKQGDVFEHICNS